jgi:hypothetical protein
MISAAISASLRMRSTSRAKWVFYNGYRNGRFCRSHNGACGDGWRTEFDSRRRGASSMIGMRRTEERMEAVVSTS